MRQFVPSLLVTAIALGLSFIWGGASALFTCALLTLMEISFSFDNAVVNAAVLRDMDTVWRKRFLTWGMLVTVFGMYYFFPLAIVAVATGLNIIDVMHIAINDPAGYSRHVMASHTQIAAFGAMFLLMVFLNFIFDEDKELHWLGKGEEKLAFLGKLKAMEAVIALAVLFVFQLFLPDEQRFSALVAGVCGVFIYIAVQGITGLFAMAGAHRSGSSAWVGFVYLNILDASFSLDAVVGSFAISNDIVIIVLGLTAGAMFVRSMTVHLVKQETLEQYVFLEHGAHYAIGALAVIMLASILMPVPEVVTGLVGAGIILLSFFSSVKYNRKTSIK